LQTVFFPVAAGGFSHTFVSLYDWVEFRGVSLQPGQKTVVEVNAPEARIAHWRSRQWQAHCIRFHRRIARRYPQVVSSTGVSNRERSRAPGDFPGEYSSDGLAAVFPPFLASFGGSVQRCGKPL